MLTVALDKSNKSQGLTILELLYKSVHGDLLGPSGLPSFETESIVLVSLARNPIIAFRHYNPSIISGFPCIELDPVD